MKRHFYFILALPVLMAVIGIACGDAGPSAPESDSTPTIAEAPRATPTSPVASTPAIAETPCATPTSSADSTPDIAETPRATATASVASTPAVAETPLATATSPAAPTPTEADSSPATPQATIYEALLGAIPDTPEARASVWIDDYALVRQVFTSIFPLPGPGDDEDAVAQLNEWIPPMFSEQGADAPPVIAFGTSPFFNWINHRNINLQYLAFDVRNMDQSIAAGPPGTALDVVRGRFDPQAADKALNACSECAPPSREEHGGIPYYSWGEDYAADDNMKFAPPAFDSFGRGGRIAVLDEYVFRTLGTSEMKALIDAHLNEGPSLADVEEFRLLARGMSQLGAYTMLLSDDVEVWGLDGYVRSVLGRDAAQADLEKMKGELAGAGPWLRPYKAYATGSGKDKDGPYKALALVHADDTSAGENVGLLRRIIEEGSSTFFAAPWSDFIDVDTLEINAEGRLLLAKLRGDLASDPFEWWWTRDSLIIYE